MRTFHLAVVAFVLGCGDPVEPLAFEDYVLRTIDGDPLPAVFIDNAAVATWILTDTLHLVEDGTGWRRTLTLLVIPGGNPSERLSSLETPLTHRVVSGRVEIELACEDTASCIAPPHLAGDRTPSGLRFDVALGRVPLVFERLGVTNVP